MPIFSYRRFIGAVLLSAAISGAALAQEPANQVAAAPAAALSPEQRIATLEADLARQTRIAENARQSLDALRAEDRLKDELLVLGRERNAQLYEIAMEIAKTHIRSRDWEPFFQGDRVKMENLRQSYEDRLRAVRIYDTTLPPSVQKRMDAELGAPPAGAAKQD